MSERRHDLRKFHHHVGQFQLVTIIVRQNALGQFEHEVNAMEQLTPEAMRPNCRNGWKERRKEEEEVVEDDLVQRVGGFFAGPRQHQITPMEKEEER